MIGRKLEQQVLVSLGRFPAVGIIGARQVGKTTLAKMLAERMGGGVQYVDLELPSDYAALADPERFLIRHSDKLVIIDEIQLRPELFPALRSLIDMKRRPGRFLLLGSSSPDLIRQSGESLAGRIAYHELSGFSLAEVADIPQETMDTLWCRGGFPESFLADSDDASIQWREDFILTYLQRDLAAMGYDIRTPAVTLRRFWQMLAHSHGQLINVRQLATNLECSRQSVRKYIDIMSETFMVRQLPPYYSNLKKRLVKTPKVYLRCSGLLHTLLGIDSMDELLGHTAMGSSWEGFCMEQVLSDMPRRWDAFFYRTRAGAEIDLVLKPRIDSPPILVEFKHSSAPKLTKGFWDILGDLQSQRSFVIYPGKNSWPIGENVEALPLTQIDRIWETE